MTCSWCSLTPSLEEMKKPLLNYHECFWFPAARTRQGSQSSGITSAGCANEIVG